MKMRVQIAPGRVATVDLKEGPMPEHVISKLVPVDGTGLMRAVPLTWSPHITLNSKNLRKLGIDIPPYIVRRLIKAGMVKGSSPTTKLTLVDAHSLISHIHATRCADGSDAPFWTPARAKAYAEAFGALKEG